MLLEQPERLGKPSVDKLLHDADIYPDPTCEHNGKVGAAPARKKATVLVQPLEAGTKLKVALQPFPLAIVDPLTLFLTLQLPQVYPQLVGGDKVTVTLPLLTYTA